MLELDEAVSRILSVLPVPVAEPVAIGQAYGRVLAASAHSPVPLPPFDNSAMDGYAVRAGDTASAGAQHPTRLRIVGKAAAGETFAGELAAGQCVRLFTGSPLPRGADAVVMQEDTRLEPGHLAEVLVLQPARPWENVRLQGEDIKAGTEIASAGSVLGAGQVSLLAAAGLAVIQAGRRPGVALLATGSELIEPGQPLGPGQIYESNRAGLAPLVQRAGGVPRLLPLVPDTLAATRSALETAFRDCDLVVTSGGVSVGEMDFIKRAFADSGGELQFWKVAIKPGRPFVFGRLQGKFLFGLPGNPVSAMVTFLLLVRPALLRWQGATEVSLPAHPGVLAEPVANPGPRRHFLRVRIDAAGNVRSAGAQASHMLSSLAAAGGLVDVPPGTTLPQGATVPVLSF
jgi:molybdopterin molybdotransferase